MTTGDPRTEISRLREKASTDRAALDALLDEVHVGHVAFVDDQQRPRVIPTAVVRDGERVLMHGSTGSPWMRRLAGGASATLAVTAIDGLVVARSAFESSIHYRSAVLFGACVALDGADKLRALDVVTDALLPGRVAEIRRPHERELSATLVLSMPIVEWSLKISAGWPADPDDDVAGGAWAGVLPIITSYGLPRDAPDLRAGIDEPASVRQLRAGAP